MNEKWHLWFWRDPEMPDFLNWPDWLGRAYGLALRARCLVVFHRYEKCDYGDGMPMSHTWYCVRCLGPYERDEEMVLSGAWSRVLWRISSRLYNWWHLWAWRFER